MDLSKYDGIVCISGDGILVEVGWLCLVVALNLYLLKQGD